MSRMDDHDFGEMMDMNAGGMGAPSGRPGIFRIIARWWWIPVVLTVAGGGGSFAYLLQARDLYLSSTFLRVRSNAPRIFKDEMRMTGESSLETECGVITSTAVLGAAVDSPALDATMGTFVNRKAKSPDGQPTPMDRDGRIRKLKKIVSAHVVKGRDIIRITCESQFPQDAADIANAVAKAYVTYQDSQERTSAGKILGILTEQHRQRNGELEQAVRLMTEFRKTHSEFTFGPGGGAVVNSSLETLTGSLTQAQLEYFDAESQFQAAQHAAYGEVRITVRDYLSPAPAAPVAMPAAKTEGDVPVPAPVDSAGGSAFPEILYSKAVRQIAQAQAARGDVIPFSSNAAQLEVMLAGAKMEEERSVAEGALEGSAKLKRIRDRIVELSQRLKVDNAKFAQSYLVLVGERLKSAESRLARIKGLHTTAQEAVRKYNNLVANYERLESDYLESKKIVDILASRIKEIRVTEDVGALNIDSLESAQPALTPAKPDRLRIYAMGAVLGLLVGLGLALLRDWLDHRIRSAEEITAVLGVPVLGAVPDMGGKGDEESYHGLHLLHAPGSGVAEAVRSVRTGLVFSTNSSNAKTILLTSPDKGDGKSTVLANLAIALAQAGRRTLVVDADFRQPSQHGIFELDATTGLADVLTVDGSVGEAICKTEVDGLDILPCGAAPSNPSELLNSDRFKMIVAELASQYDCVLFDSPPTGPVTDALILGAICDGAVLVLRAEETTRRSAEDAREGLLSVGSRLMGAVINAVPQRRGGIYSFDGYDGYGAYGREPVAKESEPVEGT